MTKRSETKRTKRAAKASRKAIERDRAHDRKTLKRWERVVARALEPGRFGRELPLHVLLGFALNSPVGAWLPGTPRGVCLAFGMAYAADAMAEIQDADGEIGIGRAHMLAWMTSNEVTATTGPDWPTALVGRCIRDGEKSWARHFAGAFDDCQGLAELEEACGLGAASK